MDIDESTRLSRSGMVREYEDDFEATFAENKDGVARVVITAKRPRKNGRKAWKGGKTWEVIAWCLECEMPIA
jgi:hypothetical protein